MFKKEHIPYRDLLLSVLALGIVYWFFKSHYTLFGILGISLLGALSSTFRQWNHKMWTEITRIMSYIFPPIFMTVIFFGVLVPSGLLYKLFRKKETQTHNSNFHDFKEKVDVSFFERVW